MIVLLCDSAQSVAIQNPWTTALISLVAAFVGGLCTLFGSILAVSLQNRYQRKKRNYEIKVNVCLKYYEFLSLYVKEIDRIDPGLSNALKQCVDKYFLQFNLNASFSYYIAIKWLKDKHSKFVFALDNLIRNQDLKNSDIHAKIRESFVSEMENTLSLLK